MIGIIDLFLLQLLIQVSLFAAPCIALCANDKCLPGGFFFAVGRDMIEDHALLGHVFRNVTVTEPIRCFEECRCDCRCISFNYLATVSQNNCQLNDINMNMSPSDLKPSIGAQNYGLAVNYNIKVSKCDSLLFFSCFAGERELRATRPTRRASLTLGSSSPSLA